MADHAAESLRFKVTPLRGDQERTEQPRDFRILSLDKIFAWIDRKDYDDNVKRELKKIVSKYPQSAYVHFGKNFQRHLAAAQKAARKNRPLFVGELGDNNYKKLQSLDEDFKTQEEIVEKKKSSTLPSVKEIKNDFDDIEMPVEKSASKNEQIQNENSVETNKIEKEVVKDTKKEPSVPYGIKEISNEE